MEKLLISACLLGEDCKYNGGNNALPEMLQKSLRERYDFVPVCPEVLGGLSIPRMPAERAGDRVLSRDGTDVSSAFESGARKVLEIARNEEIGRALLKARSPSCGSGGIYDGTFTGTIIPGDGVTAEELKEHGIRVFTEEELSEIL